jgi:type I restriction enzyme S subunit
MKKYDSYKDSGDAHIGLIPLDWHSSRVKYVGEIIGRIGFRGYTVADIVHDGNGAIALSPSNIKNQSLTLDGSTYISWEKYEESPEIKIHENDIVIVKTGSTIGKIAFVNVSEKLTLNPQLVVLKNIKVDNKFFYYAAISNFFQHFFTMNSAGGSTPAISQEKINNFSIAHPKNQEEQTQIANYLDYKTNQIDTLISNKEKLIELLKEERTAIINQAVTKGLDPNVTMKDSGIEWLDEIPEHWELTRMRYLCDIGTGGKDTENREDDGEYPFYVRSQTVERISTYSFDGEAILTAGDGVGVCKVWHYVNEKFDYHQRVYRMSDFKGIVGKYLYYYLKENFVKEVMKLSAKSTVDSLRRPMFQNFQIAFGSMEEQDEIIEFIDGQNEKIEALISKYEQEIELLKEYRTALISEVVTGKVDVREYLNVN